MTEENEKYNYAGRYQCGALVGKGSYSWVAKAFDHKLQRTVCIKVSHPLEGMAYKDRVRAFRAEAELGANLFHPNIVRILDFCFMQKDFSYIENSFLQEEYGEPIIVMDYIEGTKLCTFTEKKELSISRAVDIAIQVTQALVYTHNLPQPVIHRDIREANILINREGQVFLTDWGVSRRGPMMNTKTAKGTFGFMAPEVMDVELAPKVFDASAIIVDGRADLFSLGVLLYKLICRCSPFQNFGNPNQLREDIRSQNYVLPSKINSLCPKVLENIVVKLMKDDPNARYQKSDDLLVDLKKLVQEVGSAPIHDCENIVPDILLAKEFIDQPLSAMDEEEINTYISDAPQEIPDRISPKLKMYAVSAMVLIGVVVFYKTMMPASAPSAPEIRSAMAQEIKKPEPATFNSTPDQFEKMLEKKPHINEPSNIKRIRATQGVEKLGDGLVVYSRDNPDQRGGMSMVKNYGVTVSTTFDAMIPHEIETSNITSPVRAILTRDVIIKGKIAFPKGSKILGGAIGDQNERIQVMFDKIILPDNKEVEFDGSALDENGALGIKGKVDREKTKRMSAGAGRVMAGAASGVLDAFTGSSVAGSAINSGGQEAVDLTANEIDFKNQAATVVRLEKNIAIKVYVKRSF